MIASRPGRRRDCDSQERPVAARFLAQDYARAPSISPDGQYVVFEIGDEFDSTSSL